MNRQPAKRQRDIGFYIVVFVVLLAAVFILFSRDRSKNISYSEVRRLFEQEKVEYFVLDNDQLILTLREAYDGSITVTHKLYSLSLFYNDLGEEITRQYEEGILTDYDYDAGRGTPWWLPYLLYLLLIVIFVVLMSFIINRSAGGGSDKTAMKFGRARTRLGSDEKKRVTFNDVAGAVEEKAELQEIVEFLKNPKRFTDIGARIPKGVLLVGPPGTGKTLIAKAVAGEAGVQFLSISGSDFVELYVGIGASRVRDLFDQAKKLAPSIIFIDEIDAVGRQRGAGLGGGHDEREQTLNQLLVEMDGFGSNEGVIVMAATNRPDILDRALLRPGRFDRQVFVGLPDIKGREAILRVHSKDKPLAEDVDLGVIAKTATGFTGADLENLMNEAALLAARRLKRFITMDDIEDAMIKVIAGPEKKSKVISEKERKLTAFHEAGHAVVIGNLEHHDPVHQISIIPRGMAGGMTIFLPEEDKSFNSRLEMMDSIVSLLGGRVSEKLMLNDISTGASNDIERASSIARAMVTKYGMSDTLGPISFENSSGEVFIGRDFAQQKGYSEKTAAQIDDEVRRIIGEAYGRCETILKENANIVTTTAEYLLEHEVMDGKTFEYLLKNRMLPGADNAAPAAGIESDRSEP